MAIENPPFIDDLPIKTSIYRGFSIATFDCQRVYPSIFISPVLFIPGLKKVGHFVLGRLEHLQPFALRHSDPPAPAVRGLRVEGW